MEVANELGDPNTSAAGPLTLVQVDVRTLDGRPSSVADPLSVPACGSTKDVSLPAFAAGATFPFVGGTTVVVVGGGDVPGDLTERPTKHGGAACEFATSAIAAIAS